MGNTAAEGRPTTERIVTRVRRVARRPLYSLIA